MGHAKTKYTREELIGICVNASVPQDKWRNRDSESAQRQVGDCWALLRAGCEFEILKDPADNCCTDNRTIWLYTYSEGFNYFESGWPGDSEEDRRESMTKELHYLPTPKRLEQCKGEDWY